MDRTETNLNAALAHTTGEISRTDAKAGLLLTLDALLVAALSLLGTDVHGTALVLAIVGAVALVAGVLLALAVIRPRFSIGGENDGASFIFWATADLDTIRAGMAEDRRLNQVKISSQITMRKMRHLRYSGDASALAVIALAAAMLTR